jgi:hypothetical protein
LGLEKADLQRGKKVAILVQLPEYLTAVKNMSEKVRRENGNGGYKQELTKQTEELLHLYIKIF